MREVDRRRRKKVATITSAPDISSTRGNFHKQELMTT